jgi:hypothetical protein
MADGENAQVSGTAGAVDGDAEGRARAALRVLVDRPGYAFSDDEVLANLRALNALVATVDAVKLAFVQELRTRPSTVGGPTGRGTFRFLTEGLRQSAAHARRDLDAAEAIGAATPELPMMGAALAEGLVTRDHLDIAVATLRRVPKVLKTKIIEDGGVDPDGVVVAATGAEVIDRALTEEALAAQPSSVQRLGRQIVHRLDPDRADNFNADAYERSTCSISNDFAGMTMLRLITDPANGLLIRSAIARFSAPRPAGTAIGEDGEPVLVPDTRTLGQRQAEAAVELLLTGAGLKRVAPDSATPEPVTIPEEEGAAAWPPSAAPLGNAVELLIIATLDQFLACHGTNANAETARAGLARTSLAGQVGTYPGATLDPALLARFACDSPLRRILTDYNGRVLNLGRSGRFAIPAQRQALAVRDGGCIAPGCHAPPEWSEAHHLTPWEQGGRTDIDNLVLLCRTHHTAHHAGAYDLDMRDGIPWVRVPTWVDPDRPWLRNTTHRHHTTADGIARTLLEPPGATG